MGKLAPQELWRNNTIERFIAFKQSGELERLRKEGLAACGRKKRFTSLEWAKSPMRKRYLSSRYMEWYRKCEMVAQKFGLANWTVVCACLISDYQPDKEPFPIESKWPQIRVITESTDTQFLARLAYEAQLRGLHVILRQGSVEITYLFMNPVPIMNIEPPPLPSSMPPLSNSFYMRIEAPVGYPPQAAKKLHKDASQLEKDILIALGYSIPKRLRTSPLVAMADNLRVAKGQLAPNEAYDIIDKIYGTDDSMENDQKRRKLVASRRNKLRKRLVKPYEASES
jgi:hypothetical protein